ncbi:unnamed protein product, partial [Ectocarpus sp. 8 AP-2014]
RLWDSSTGACLKTIFAEGNPSVSFSTFSPNGKYVLAGTLDDSLRLWQIGHDTKCVKTYKGHVNRRYSVTACFDGNKRVVSGSEDGSIYIWDINSSKSVVQRLQGHSGEVL